jgi:asparagine synthase (glutamine-hydrolysing)
MCGIAGFSTKKVGSPENILRNMLAAIHHRGPDSEGMLFDDGFAFGMKRLSIIDLMGGEQPIYNEDKTISIVFNGEIYNFNDLRNDLLKKGHSFYTRSDTEVIVHLYEEYGEAVVDFLNGMFSFCIFDKKKRKLFLARDRAGKKPLYFYMKNKNFVFGSDLMTVLEHPCVPRVPDEGSVRKYFAYGYVPSPNTMIRNVKKLPAGHYLVVDLDSYSCYPKLYWDFGYGRNRINSEKLVVENIDKTLTEAVERRLISDVPLGVFLSGGLDSSLVVALMRKSVASKDIHSFTIGFEEKKFDESGYAASVAKILNTDHHLEVFTLNDAINVIDEIIDKLDEPIADPSLLPTYLLSRFTRQNGIIVALSGDGGDEMFGGYPKYYIHRYAELYNSLPEVFRKSVVNKLFGFVPLRPENRFFNYKAERFLSSAIYSTRHRNQFWVSPFTPEEIDSGLFNNRIHENSIYFEDADAVSRLFKGDDCIDEMMYLDAKLMLQNMYLTKVDRASMAVSLEVRSPFLDREIMELSATIPWRYKVKGRQTKYILKKMAEKYLPHDIIYRPKKGFGIPLAYWIKKLSKEIFRLATQCGQDFIRKEYINNLIIEHISNKVDNSTKIWSIYVFLRWYERIIQKG